MLGTSESQWFIGHMRLPCLCLLVIRLLWNNDNYDKKNMTKCAALCYAKCPNHTPYNAFKCFISMAVTITHR